MGINMVKIRAKVELGTTSVVTPYVLSFNVRKARNQIHTFDASLKMDKDEISTASVGMVKISAGEGAANTLIFTGIVRNMSMAPCWDDPGYVVVNVSGEDVTSILRGKTYSRRCRGIKSVWVTIDSVVRPGIRDGRWSYETGILTISPDMMVSKNLTGTTVSPLAKNGGVATDSTPAPINISFSYNGELTDIVNS